MPKWVPVPKPDAELTPVENGESMGPMGERIAEFVTANGVRFARIEDPNHIVTWLQAVEA